MTYKPYWNYKIEEGDYAVRNKTKPRERISERSVLNAIDESEIQKCLTPVCHPLK